MSKDLCYLLGAIRDGSLPVCKIKKEVSFATDPTKEWLEMVAQIASREFQIPYERFKIYPARDKKSRIDCFRLKLYSAVVYDKLARIYEPGSQARWKTPSVAFPLE